MLVPLLAPAQQHGDTSVSRGDALRRRQYETNAALTLYVDPTGNDGNACTSTGTAACLTLTGALARVPGRINHNVTINIANGTYTDTVNISGFTLLGNATNTFTITGSLTGATLATGTNTGTSTAFTDQPNDGSTLGTLTDSGQAWTVNDLKGYFLEFTSGAQTGQYRPIISNTATTVRFAGTYFTDPIVGDTYRIATPGAVWSSGGIASVTGIVGSAGTQFNIHNVQQTVNRTLSDVGPLVRMHQNRLIVASGTGLTINGARFVMAQQNAMYIVVATAAPAINVSPSTTSRIPGSVSLSHVYVRTTAGSGATALLTSTNGSMSILSDQTVYAEGTTGVSLVDSTFTAFGVVSRTALFVDCSSVASSVGVRVELATKGRASVPSAAFLYNNNIQNCTSGFEAYSGGTVFIPTGTTKTLSVTNQVVLDGTTYTYSDIESNYGFVKMPRGTMFSIGLAY